MINQVSYKSLLLAVRPAAVVFCALISFAAQGAVFGAEDETVKEEEQRPPLTPFQIVQNAEQAAGTGEYEKAVELLDSVINDQAQAGSELRGKLLLLRALYNVRDGSYSDGVMSLKDAYVSTGNKTIQAAASFIMYYLKVHVSSTFRLFKIFPMGIMIEKAIIKGLTRERQFRFYLFNYPSIIIFLGRLAFFFLFLAAGYYLAPKMKWGLESGARTIFNSGLTETTALYAVSSLMGIVFFSWVKATDFYINNIISGLVLEGFVDSFFLLMGAAVYCYIKEVKVRDVVLGSLTIKETVKEFILYVSGLAVTCIFINFLYKYEILNAVYGVNYFSFRRIAVSGSYSLLFWGIIFVISPLAEEIFFRGMYYSALRRTLNRHVAAAFVSLLFSALHFESGAFVPLFALSFILCQIVEEKKTLFPAIMLHGLYNIMAYSGLAIKM